jgi:hypothetical protein
MPPAVRTVVRDLERRWRRLGVPRALREPVLAEVGADLRAAYAQGRTPEVVLGVAVAEFAEQVARENGWLVAWPMYGRMLSSAAVGAVVAIVVGFALVLPAVTGVIAVAGTVLSWVGVEVSDSGGYGGGSSWYLPIVYAIYAAFGVGFIAAVLAAVRRGMKAAVELRRTVRAGAVLLPVSAAVSLPLAVAIGRASDYSSAPLVVAAEFGLVLGLAGASLLAARAWVLRLF